MKAVQEVAELTVTGPAGESGQLELRLDCVTFLVEVAKDDPAERIANRIRNLFFDGWKVGGSGTKAVFTADKPGSRAVIGFRAGPTGVTATTAVTAKGEVSTPQDIAKAVKGLAFDHWTVNGTVGNRYPSGNVVDFTALTTGAKGGSITVADGDTKVGAKGFAAQHGAFLVAKIIAVDGRRLTLDRNAITAANQVHVAHDDTLAVQAAIDSLKHSGGTVRLGPGQYNISTTLTVPSRINLIGAGKAASVIDIQAVSRRGIHVPQSSSDVYIGHLQVCNANCPDAYFGYDAERQGVYIQGSQRVTVEHCLFDLCDDSAIYLASNQSSRADDCVDCKVLHNVVRNTGEGSGIEISRADSILVHGNTITQSAHWGIRICGAKQIVCTDNHVDNCAIGIKLQAYSDPGYPSMRPASDALVAGNSIRDIGTFGLYASGWIENCALLDNLVVRCGDSGFIAASQRFKNAGTSENGGPAEAANSYTYLLRVEGNHFRHCPMGISVRGDHRRIVISGNTVVEPHRATGTAYGIHLSSAYYDSIIGKTGYASLDQVFVEHNRVFSSATAAVHGIHVAHLRAGCEVYARYNTIVLDADPQDARFVSREPDTGALGTVITTLGQLETNTRIRHRVLP